MRDRLLDPAMRSDFQRIVTEFNTTRTTMKFSMRDWRRMYDKVQELSKMLKDSRPTITEDGKKIPPVIELSEHIQDSLEAEIKLLLTRVGKYLDQCGVHARKPLWEYDRKNSATHASAPDFRYGHLLV